MTLSEATTIILASFQGANDPMSRELLREAKEIIWNEACRIVADAKARR